MGILPTQKIAKPQWVGAKDHKSAPLGSDPAGHMRRINEHWNSRGIKKFVSKIIFICGQIQAFPFSLFHARTLWPLQWS
jgi:hypothetical protein